MYPGFSFGHPPPPVWDDGYGDPAPPPPGGSGTQQIFDVDATEPDDPDLPALRYPADVGGLIEQWSVTQQQWL